MVLFTLMNKFLCHFSKYENAVNQVLYNFKPLLFTKNTYLFKTIGLQVTQKLRDITVSVKCEKINQFFK